MPELPEVETVVRGLRPHLIGRVISQVQILLPKTVWLDKVRATGNQEAERFSGALLGKTIENIARRGKMIIISLSDELVLMIHLKMTGQLILVSRDQSRVSGGHPNPDIVKDLPVKSTRVAIRLDDCSMLYFNDQRQFGYIKLLTKSSLNQHKAFQSYGPEPFDKTVTNQYLWARGVRRPRSTVKQFILDQSVIAGVGNIYADEALFASQIYPGTQLQDLTKSELSNILANVRDVLEKGIEYGGTTSQHFLQSSGEKGSMQHHLKVYRRAGQPCVRCRTPIERMVIGGRGTHYCPQCQKNPYKSNK